MQTYGLVASGEHAPDLATVGEGDEEDEESYDYFHVVRV